MCRANTNCDSHRPDVNLARARAVANKSRGLHSETEKESSRKTAIKVGLTVWSQDLKTAKN